MGRTITRKEIYAVMMPSLTRVAAYARVSCAKDEMLHSLAVQVSYYSEYIQQHTGWVYAGVYADEAMTGTKDNRPEFQRMLTDCRTGNIDLILTKSISRFARNTVDLLKTVRELKGLCVGVYFEEQNIHTLSGDGELMISILASYAQEESRSASENQKWRIRKDFEEGRQSNHARIYGYEYRDGNLVVIPEEAETVRLIFADYLAGMGINAIMKKLSGNKIHTKNGGRWTENGVAFILRNEKYLGDLLLQKSFTTDHLTKNRKKNRGELPQYYVNSNHEPIISRDTFAAVQEEIARRAAALPFAPKKQQSEFSGIIHCRQCGANFRRKINSPGTPYARATWACSTYTNRGKDLCSARRVPEDILKAKCAEVLGLPDYSPETFKSKITEIHVPEDGILLFIFADGTEKTLYWEYLSRRTNWNDEMREAARRKAKEGVCNA